jgi:hypothetical protein
MDTFGARLASVALSHHLPHEHDRCVVVGSRLVCRRCLVLYPVAFTVMFLTLAGFGWSTSLDPVLLLALPVPVTVEFVAEKLGFLRYVASRQIAFTLLAAPALGTGLARHIRSPFSTWFVVMVLAHGGVAALAHVVSSSRQDRSARAARVAIEEADPVLDGFASADEFRRYLDSRAVSQS